MSFSGGQSSSVPEMNKGDKVGRLYLTTHRMIFNNKNSKESLKSFSFPFVALRDVELEQPIFGANYIKGKVLAQPNGNFEGEVKFKLHFKSGGAIDFGTAMLRAAQMASRHFVGDRPPPYTAPSGPWYAAAPPAYSANPEGYMGWVPPTNVFPDQPARKLLLEYYATFITHSWNSQFCIYDRCASALSWHYWQLWIRGSTSEWSWTHSNWILRPQRTPSRICSTATGACKSKRSVFPLFLLNSKCFQNELPPSYDESTKKTN